MAWGTGLKGQNPVCTPHNHWGAMPLSPPVRILGPQSQRVNRRLPSLGMAPHSVRPMASRHLATSVAAKHALTAATRMPPVTAPPKGGSRPPKTHPTANCQTQLDPLPRPPPSFSPPAQAAPPSNGSLEASMGACGCGSGLHASHRSQGMWSLPVGLLHLLTCVVKSIFNILLWKFSNTHTREQRKMHLKLPSQSQHPEPEALSPPPHSPPNPHHWYPLQQTFNILLGLLQKRGIFSLYLVKLCHFPVQNLPSLLHVKSTPWTVMFKALVARALGLNPQPHGASGFHMLPQLRPRPPQFHTVPSSSTHTFSQLSPPLRRTQQASNDRPQDESISL